MLKKMTFPARVNANLGIRIPDAARAQLKIGKGSQLLVTVEVVGVPQEVA
jgi:bifunctional DNA-binding transcriptional regulator/antitoxin component of YhaV-PrlF toxin-antitoxin module